MPLKEIIRLLFLVICVIFIHRANGSPSSEAHNETLGKYYKCDFERGLCTFLSNSVYNRENWKIHRGNNISTDYGPSVDHTLGTANGSYLFANISAAKSVEIKLQTTALKGNYCVRFFYYMYGAGKQDLTVTVQNIATSSSNKENFLHSNTQGDRWKEAKFTVLETRYMKLKGYKLVFTASGKFTSQLGGAIALDDIEIMAGECQQIKGDSMKLCTFDEHDCGYIADVKYWDKWEQKLHSKSSSYSSVLPKTDHSLGTEYGGFWFISTKDSSVQSTFLRSPIYKAPKNSVNCLQFFYYIDEGASSWFWWAAKEVYLQAGINYPGSKTTKPTWLTTKVNNATIQKQWRYAEVQVNITEDYQFQFNSVIDVKNDAVVAIDDVKLKPGRCLETGFCDFDEDMCTWKNGGLRYEWERYSRSTKPNLEIGPEFDNTFGTADGYYILFSSRFKPEGSEAILESEIFPSDEEEFCLTFYYQMSGNNSGILKVVRKDGSTTNSTLWHLQGDQKNVWEKGMVIIEPSIKEYQIVFHGITGNGTDGFMAIDDIRIRKGEKCQIIPFEAKPPEEDFSSTYEPFKHTTDFNSTNELANTTYARNVSTPEPRTTVSNFKTTTLKPARCLRDADCLNGGVCKRMGRYESLCDCPPYFGGEWCELDLCEKLHSKCLAMGAICKVVGLHAVCECPPETVYHPKTELCEDICDSWKCNHGTCQVIGRNYRCICDEGYTGSKCDQETKQILVHRNFSALWFIILAIINICTVLLLIGIFCAVCNIKKSMRQ
ncbi:MAM and LDL-receptor class A domain-containing protein 1 [Nephila pilipes]|uniref:MAM and LDL-receptor class A domain-containing protein 1 n=1 Tax=Nephila pilipes TaxID=299642 RepID=A0A8X6UCD2_NEPPI|nr:MAM and LDL-receptor class A domain-containing protein 1 [Nephila pilipes]